MVGVEILGSHAWAADVVDTLGGLLLLCRHLLGLFSGVFAGAIDPPVGVFRCCEGVDTDSLPLSCQIGLVTLRILPFMAPSRRSFFLCF